MPTNNEIFQIENQNPFIPANSLPVAASARLLTPGKMHLQTNLSLSNTVNIQRTTQERLILDYEAYRLLLDINYGLTPDWNTGIRLPYSRYQAGFMDNAINRFHHAFGLREGSRPYVENNQLHIQYSNNGNTRYNQDSIDDIGDIALHTDYRLKQTASTIASLRTELRIPMHDTDSLDIHHNAAISISAAFHQTLSDHWTLYTRAGYSLQHKPGNIFTPQAHKIAFATSALNWNVYPQLTLRMQLDGHTSFYPDSKLRFLGDALLLTAGTSWRTATNSVIDIGITEDIKTEASPDFTLHFGFGFYY